MYKLLLFVFSLSLSLAVVAQPIFLDEFDDGTPIAGSNDNFTTAEENGQFIINGAGTNGAFDPIYIGLPGEFDISASTKLFINANSNILGTTIRIDLGDGSGNWTNAEPLQNTLTTDLRDLEYDFTNVDQNGIDMTKITELLVFINPGTPNFDGQINMEYLSLGFAPEGERMSDIYQDHMDLDSSLTSFAMHSGFEYSRTVDEEGDSTIMQWTGDGTGGMWEPVVYFLRPAPEFIQTNIDMSDNPRVFVKARASVEGTSFRLDVEDVDFLSSNGTAATNILTNEFQVYEFDLTGAEGFPVEGTPCTEESTDCIVDLTAITQLLFYVDPGTGEYLGTVEIDYISFGTSLDPPGPEAELIYSDQFDNARLDATESDNYDVVENDGVLSIVGNGLAGAFTTVSYNFSEATDEQDTARVGTLLDFEPAQDKVFLRARTVGVDQVSLRIDVIDSMDLVSNGAPVTKRITSEWSIVQYDFGSAYQDFGFGGTGMDLGCTPADPCGLNSSALGTLLLYPNANDGGFEGTIEIDWISIGQPLEEIEITAPGIANYSDTLDNAAEVFTGSPNGITYTVDEGRFTIMGDGTSSVFQQIEYTLRDGDGNASKADVIASGDQLFIRARLREGDSKQGLRIDLVDEFGLETTNPSVIDSIDGRDYATYTYDFANTYTDGGFGGTQCPMGEGPCPVDGQRITSLKFYPSPDNGNFNGTVDITWISFGQELTVSVADFAELNALKVYPNPASDQIGIEYDMAQPGEVTISLFDGLGRRQLVRDLGRQLAGNNFESVDIAMLPIGTYHLQVMVNGVPAKAVTVLKR